MMHGLLQHIKLGLSCIRYSVGHTDLSISHCWKAFSNVVVLYIADFHKHCYIQAAVPMQLWVLYT